MQKKQSYITTCIGCGKEVELINFRTHTRACKLYQDKRAKMLEQLTYDFLYNEYIIQEKSISQITKECGFKNSRDVKKKLEEFNIPIRTGSETRFAKGYIELSQKTSLQKYGTPYHTSKDSTIRQKIFDGVKNKYGVDNIFQSEEIKEKIKQTNLQRYGVEYISQSPTVKQHLKETVRKKYGVDNVFQVPEIIDKINRTRQKSGVHMHTSKLADDFLVQLAQLIPDNKHVYYHPKSKEYCIYYNKKLYCYDFVDSIHKKCIEINGNYWHANPKLYSSDWVNPHSQLTAMQIWERDEEKYTIMREQRNYDVLVIWEDEIKNDITAVLNKCIQFLNQ